MTRITSVNKYQIIMNYKAAECFITIVFKLSPFRSGRVDCIPAGSANYTPHFRCLICHGPAGLGSQPRGSTTYRDEHEIIPFTFIRTCNNTNWPSFYAYKHT